MCIELSFYNILAKSSKGLFLHSLVKLPKFFLLKNLWYLENISSTYCTLRCNQRVVLNLRFHPWEICAVPFSPVKCTYTCLIQISLQNGLNKYCFSSLAFLLFNLRLIHFPSWFIRWGYAHKLHAEEASPFQSLHQVLVLETTSFGSRHCS